MKIKTIAILLAWLPIVLYGQTVEKNTVFWSNGVNWEAIVKQASAEHKMIFVDCYATWCGPCKYMDEHIFTKPIVFDELNSHFIALKIQLDSSREDNPEIVKRRLFYSQFKSKYPVKSIPAYLFFSEQGELLHQEVGVKSVSEFHQLLKDVSNTSNQYYTLIKDYQKGVRNYEQMAYVTDKALEIGDNRIAEMIGRDYIKNYLFKQTRAELLQPKSIKILGSFLNSTDDETFKWLFKNYIEVDRAMSTPNYTWALIDPIVRREVVDPHTSARIVNWKSLQNMLTKKFGMNYTTRMMLDTRQRWYLENKKFPLLFQTYQKRYELFGVQQMQKGIDRNPNGVNNNMAWEVFQKSNDRNVLKQAVVWMEAILNKEETTETMYEWELDTYANLLYKAGERNKAIIEEEKALEIANEKLEKDKTRTDVLLKEIDSLKETLKKIKAHEPTWLSK